MGWCGLDLSYGPVAESCERGNKPPGFIKLWEILDLLKDSALWISLV
jgi:hypothetical protein